MNITYKNLHEDIPVIKQLNKNGLYKGFQTENNRNVFDLGNLINGRYVGLRVDFYRHTRDIVSYNFDENNKIINWLDYVLNERNSTIPMVREYRCVL